MKYIIGGRIITPTEVIEGAALAFDECFKGITALSNIPCDAEVIDAGGNYIAPGLVDIHIHGYLNADTSDGKSDSIRTMAYGVAANGCTSFLPTTMTVSMTEINAALDSVRAVKEESASWDGAEILGVHAEGPFINPSKKGAQAAENILKPEAQFLIDNADIIKSVTLAPEMDENHAAIKAIRENTDILVSMGHTGAKFEEAVSAVADGVQHATHLFNAMTPLAHRDPGVVGAVFTTDVSCELIADTFHINPNLFAVVEKIKGDKLILITDCTRAGGMPDGEYDLGGQPIYLKGIECRLADGTIAGSVLKLNQAVKNLLDYTSLSVPAAFAAASLYPARAIKADKTKGSIELGKDADFFICDDDFNAVATYKAGRIIYKTT